jgi:hypothetical protein
MEPFVESSAVVQDGDALRERMAKDGYLFLRGVVDPGAILEARREILTICGEAGWLAPGAGTVEGVAAPGVCWIPDMPEYIEVYDRVLCGERFNSLAFDPGLLGALRALFGEEPLPHARNIARIVFPQAEEHTTPAHQDYIYIQGTEETYTAWIPLGDCPARLGSLSILSGSNTGEIFEVSRSLGAGGFRVDTSEMPFRWVGGDYRLGDAVIFHSLTVHRALPNLSGDRMRLSVDFRYQPLSHPIDAGSLRPHMDRIAWEEVYAGWSSDRYKYYWRDLPIRYAEQDRRVHAVRSTAAPMQADSPASES